MPEKISTQSTPEPKLQSIKTLLPNSAPAGVSPDRATTYITCDVQKKGTSCNPQQLADHFQTIVRGKIVVQQIQGREIKPTDIKPITCADCPFARK